LVSFLKLEAMMKAGIIGTCVLAALLAGGAGVTGIATGGPLGDDVPEARPLRMLFSGQVGRLLTLRSELDLSAEQRGEIRDVFKNHKQELATAMKPVAAKRRALRDATLAEQTNEATIRQAADELGKAIGDAAVVGAEIRSEIHQVLTPEQRARVSQFREQSDSAVDHFLDDAAKPE
jgi:Spy/CpxP family protein refolding chaperone